MMWGGICVCDVMCGWDVWMGYDVGWDMCDVCDVCDVICEVWVECVDGI